MKFNQIITTTILGRTKFVMAPIKRHDGRLIPEYSEKEAEAKRFDNAQAVIDKIYNTHDLVFTVKHITLAGKEKIVKPGDVLD